MPCNETNPNGAPRLYTDGKFQYPDGKAKRIPWPFVDNNERPDDQYPFWLTQAAWWITGIHEPKRAKQGISISLAPPPLWR